MFSGDPGGSGGGGTGCHRWRRGNTYTQTQEEEMKSYSTSVDHYFSFDLQNSFFCFFYF